ncbi:MAG: hypothetical protein MI743_12955 [Sneathiellales bacterium]|nr:hypothetical protein [Sneathiellales bacterium]
MQRVFFVYAVALVSVLSSTAAANDVQVTITKENCSRIEKHVAASDVAYKPGVDVHGRPVVSADLDGVNRIRLPDEIVIDLSLPLQDLLSSPPERLKNADVRVGEITYNMKTGKMLFNGQELADPAMHALAEECAKRYPKD